ncbi:DUF87 domain-containing protein [Candidatus Woesearchaeota archaeon]|nr:DUF87 domain-containing protein [Candidatus Woesearchaeota archaeon]
MKIKRGAICILILIGIMSVGYFEVFAANEDIAASIRNQSSNLVINITCGNNRCETGENEYNCPQDCSKSPFDFKMSFTNPQIWLGAEEKIHFIEIQNNLKTEITVNVNLIGDTLNRLIHINKTTYVIKSRETGIVNLVIRAWDVTPGVYNGYINLNSAKKNVTIPVGIQVYDEIKDTIDVQSNIIGDEIENDGSIKLHITIYNPNFKTVNMSISYYINNSVDGLMIYNSSEYMLINSSRVLVRDFDLNSFNLTNRFYSHNMTVKPGTLREVPPSDYYVTVKFNLDNQTIYLTDTVIISKPFWTKDRIWVVIGSILFIAIGGGGLFGYKKYMELKKNKARYVFPMDYSKLPQQDNYSLWLGLIAETKKKAFYSMNDLTTHALVAGSTGSGKSVSASVIVEEVLEKKVPVIIFDPTSQWTGFVRPCKDKNLLKYYPKFSLTDDDSRPYKGLIYDVKSPDVQIDFKKFMNPGEVTVFNLGNLKVGEYDIATKNIVDTIFHMRWEESPELKMLLVFDEVHRLLEKYGGKGGYIALEKGAREFRKWGIGMIMASQVSADFKESIAGNILTEVQLNTKSMEDIKKIAQKYGTEFSERISREGIGVAMIQNPKYNDGKPWFINFRPTYHSPHKIAAEELEMYAKFTDQLSEIEVQITKLREKKVDTSDIEMEIKLAKDKLKEGHFRMAEIYINGLFENLNKLKGKK